MLNTIKYDILLIVRKIDMEIEKSLTKINITSLILIILAIINIILLFVIHKIMSYVIILRVIEIVMLLLVIILNNKGKNRIALIIYVLFNILLFSNPFFINVINYKLDLMYDLNRYFYELFAIFNFFYVYRIIKYLNDRI